MSAAFDMIDRRHLLDIVKANTVPSEWHSPWHKSKWYFNIKTIHKQCRQLKPDSIHWYLKHDLKEVRPILPSPTTSHEEEIPNEVVYVDNVDFIGQNYADMKKIQEVKKKKQPKVKTDETEYTSISKSNEGWKEVKKVGSFIDDHKDLERRKQLATVALNKLKKGKRQQTENLN